MQTALIVGAAALAMLLVEQLRPGRRWDAVTGWWPRAIMLNLAQAATVWIGGQTWDRWLPEAALWRLQGHGVVVEALVGYLLITFVYYWWHRARHASPFLWRWLHQVHHSAQRIEIVTSFYKHPLEIALNGVLSSAILYVALGLSPSAAAIAVLLTGLAELFYHWNIRTPYWLGFLFQRPESHCVHHQRARHRNNYSDLPLWDMLFGTFENPRSFDGRCGFAQGDERRLLPMLLGRDLHQPERGRKA